MNWSAFFINADQMPIVLELVNAMWFAKHDVYFWCIFLKLRRDLLYKRFFSQTYSNALSFRLLALVAGITNVGKDLCITLLFWTCWSIWLLNNLCCVVSRLCNFFTRSSNLMSFDIERSPFRNIAAGLFHVKRSRCFLNLETRLAWILFD